MALFRKLITSLKKVFFSEGRPKKTRAGRTVRSRSNRKTTSRQGSSRRGRRTHKTRTLSRKSRLKHKRKTASSLLKKPSHRRPRRIPRRTKSSPEARPSLTRTTHSLKIRPEEKRLLVGEVTHYFSKIEVCVIKVTREPIKLGDRIVIGKESDKVRQEVKSLQIENSDVARAVRGQLVGLKVKGKVNPGDSVYKVA